MTELEYTWVTSPLASGDRDQMIRSLENDGNDQFTIEQIQPGNREIADLQRDDKTVALTPTMPFSLIEPMNEPMNESMNESMNGPMNNPEGRDVSDPAQSDASSGLAWGVRAVEAHNSPYNGSGVVVAVLDTGILPDHPAFNGLSVVQENFTPDPSADDGNGHGTHCAGTIAGGDVDGLRIGVAPQLDTLLAGKVLSDSGQGSTTAIVRGIHWASLQGAQIISMSLGIDFPGFVDRLHKEHGYELNAAVSLALQAYGGNVDMFNKLGDSLSAMSFIGQGALVVAAAGNESRRPSYTIATSPPAVAPSIVSVAAVDEQLAVASFSNTFADVSAPGVQISSAGLNGALSVLSGTSMAAPHVAGVAALWAQKFLETERSINIERVRQTMFAAVTETAAQPGQELENTGRGLVVAPDF